jgi:MOSC domain-containing protein YiiM
VKSITKKVLKLYVSKKEVFSLKVDKDGVIGDKFYAKDLNRSVLFASTKSYDVAKSNTIDLTFGELGENILVNFDIYTLPIGTTIKIGSAKLQISQNCTLCNSLSKINPKLPKLLKDDRGIFAFVLEAGEIKQGDKIIIGED